MEKQQRTSISDRINRFFDPLVSKLLRFGILPNVRMKDPLQLKRLSSKDIYIK